MLTGNACLNFLFFFFQLSVSFYASISRWMLCKNRFFFPNYHVCNSEDNFLISFSFYMLPENVLQHTYIYSIGSYVYKQHSNRHEYTQIKRNPDAQNFLCNKIRGKTFINLQKILTYIRTYIHIYTHLSLAQIIEIAEKILNVARVTCNTLLWQLTDVKENRVTILTRTKDEKDNINYGTLVIGAQKWFFVIARKC